MDVKAIQQHLKEAKLDGWLMYDFQGTNPIALSVTGIKGMSTRRWYCFIPAEGEVQWIIPVIEQHLFANQPGIHYIYQTWKGLWEGLSKILKSRTRIAMEYSPNCAIPYVSRVDAGTLELVQQMGVNVVSSAHLVQFFQATLNAAQYESHLKAVESVYKAKDDAIRFIQTNLEKQSVVTEWMVREFIADRFIEYGLITSFLPIIAVNKNASNPHYEPTEDGSTAISRDDLVLLDIWAKLDQRSTIYADITWMVYTGKSVPSLVENIWKIVRDARDAGVRIVQKAFVGNMPICGYEVDDATRKVITDAGYGKYFIHSTGHNIHEKDHGDGAHMDNFETYDEREILPRTLFSIEPGIYLPELGIRSEINVYIHPEKGPQITTPPQTSLTLI